MYLKKILLKNIKCFSHIEIDFAPANRPRNWTAILGRNGLGKSTLLQAIGAALVGPVALRELLPVAEGWVRKDRPYGEIEAEILWTEGDAQTPHWPKTKTPYLARFAVTGDKPEHMPASLSEYSVSVIVDWPGEGSSREREKISKDMSRLKQTSYAEGKKGWFSCGYGPFRRLSGGAQPADRILYSNRKPARFITLFREDAALTNVTDWLISLYNTARDGDDFSKHTLEQVMKAFERELLPELAELLVNSHSALLKIGEQREIPFRDLSDGYRSMLALGIDLLRWASSAFPDTDNIMEAAGVVLIDELDAHAHPAWQRQIGYWLREKFPNLQFIVTTHSPFLAQVASEPGGNIVLEMGGDGVRTRQDVESVETWRADQILTDLLELKTTRSPEVEKKIKRFQELSQKRARLTPEQAREYQQLQLWVEGLPPSIEEPGARKMAEALQTYVEKHQSELERLQ